MKRHADYCPIARALDVVGDRWSLLILRELLFGDWRFSDLRRNIPGISPTLLTDRLQALAKHGLVATRELPPPASRTVYTATARARDVVPILQAMARFGMDLLPPVRSSTRIRPSMAAYGAVMAWYDAEAARNVDEVYRLIIDGEKFSLTSSRGEQRRAQERELDLVLTAPAHVILAARKRETTLSDAIGRGVVKVEGSKRALRNFQNVFRLP
jgi:DNA-binding HxlR family transcriptional regulator